MRFAISDSAAHGSAYTWCVGWIDEVHVQADGNAGGVVQGVFEGVTHDFAHAALVDVAHSENMDAGFLDDLAFLSVEIPRANNNDVARFGFRFETKKVDQFWRAVAHDGRERHAVHV